MQGELQEHITAARAGDRHAFDSLFARTMPQLIAFLRVKVGRLVGSRESVCDLAQSVCREVLEDMDGFQYAGDAAFRHWLFQQASRKIIDRHRYLRRARRDAAREVPADAEGEEDARSLLDCYASFCTPSQVAGAREELERIEGAIARLPENQRDAVCLSRLMSLPYPRCRGAPGLYGGRRASAGRAWARQARAGAILNQLESTPMDELLESLVARSIQALERGDTAAVDGLCDDHPQLAPEIRRQLERLGEAGLLGANALEISERVGPYLVLEPLGRGGMGSVFLAEQDEPVRRRVALKVIRLGNGQSRGARSFRARASIAGADEPPAHCYRVRRRAYRSRAAIHRDGVRAGCFDHQVL